MTDTWISDIPAVDLVAELLHQFRNALEVRMDGERAPKRVQRAFLIAKILEDDAQAGKRAEVARLPRQHFAYIRQRPGKILFGEIDAGAPVPGFGEFRLDVYDGVKELDREIVLLRVDRGLDAAHQDVRGIARGIEPDRPDSVLEIFGAFFVGRELECLEKTVDLRLLAPVNAWKRARRLHWPERLTVARLNECGHQEGEHRDCPPGRWQRRTAHESYFISRQRRKEDSALPAVQTHRDPANYPWRALKRR